MATENELIVYFDDLLDKHGGSFHMMRWTGELEKHRVEISIDINGERVICEGKGNTRFQALLLMIRQHEEIEERMKREKQNES